VEAKLPPKCANIIIDLRRVEFMDSHGVGFFASLLKKTHNNKGCLIFVGAAAQPAAVLNMVGFNSPHVTYCDNIQQARAMLLL
jgi:anti-anti-sigma factor